MANERIPFSITPTSCIIMLDGKTYTVTQDSHPKYVEIREALKTKDFETVRELIDVTNAINLFGNGKIQVVNGVIMYGTLELHNTLTERILQQMDEGFDVNPMVAFLENLMQNPSKRAVMELYSFLEQNSLPITDDGHFVAYKRVRSDYKDFYTGKMDNSVGTVVEMPRNMVDDNKDQTCSTGLHFCSLEYLPSYHSNDGRIVIVKVNPADVVSIPTDYNNAKGRACKYLVLEDYAGDENTEKFKSSVYDTSTDTDVESDDFDFYDDSSSSSDDYSNSDDVEYTVCYSCNSDLHPEAGSNNDGLCPVCGSELEDEDDVTVAPAPVAPSPEAWPLFPTFAETSAAPVAPVAQPQPQGVLYTKEQAAQILGISLDALRKRLARGVSVQIVQSNGQDLVRFV